MFGGRCVAVSCAWEKRFHHKLKSISHPVIGLQYVYAALLAAPVRARDCSDRAAIISRTIASVAPSRKRPSSCAAAPSSLQHMSYLCKMVYPASQVAASEPSRAASIAGSRPPAHSTLYHDCPLCALSPASNAHTSPDAASVERMVLSKRICLCGRCAQRAHARAAELRAQALRLAQASARARVRGDVRRAAAYAHQAAAAVAEARQCEQAPPRASRFIVRAAAALAAALGALAPRRCKRLPQRWQALLARAQLPRLRAERTWR
eukprot:IDg19793t1